jgi:hypothetical protein
MATHYRLMIILASALGNSTVLLYLAVSLTVQRLILLNRASRMDIAGELVS